MNRLVSNGVHLLKRAGHLVRTPIRVTLTADRRAYYSVAGHYDNNHLPDRGFVASATYNNVVQAGWDCINAYLTPVSAYQMWRSTNLTEPETAWYQGGFSPAAPTIAQTYTSCEAYIQLAAYHFTIPSNLLGLELTSAKVSFVNGGAVKAWQSAGLRSNKNTTLRGWSGWTNSWYQPFYVDTTLRTPSQMHSQSAWDGLVNVMSDGGTFNGVRDLWRFAGTTRDGGIPTINGAPTKSYNMGEDTLAEFANAGSSGVWIIPDVAAEINGSSYRPSFYTSEIGWWGCLSTWGLKVEVELS